MYCCVFYVMSIMGFFVVVVLLLIISEEQKGCSKEDVRSILSSVVEFLTVPYAGIFEVFSHLMILNCSTFQIFYYFSCSPPKITLPHHQITSLHPFISSLIFSFILLEPPALLLTFLLLPLPPRCTSWSRPLCLHSHRIALSSTRSNLLAHGSAPLIHLLCCFGLLTFTSSYHPPSSPLPDMPLPL